MASYHQKMMKDNQHYASWHKDPNHSRYHWAIFLALVTFSLAMIHSLIWQEIGAENPSHSAAAAPRRNTGTASISLTPQTMAFSGISGLDAPAPQNLGIANPSPSSLSWQVVTQYDWCHVSPTSGMTNASSSIYVSTTFVSVSVDAPSNIGSFTCRITVSGNASNSPQYIDITYTVEAPPATITDTIAPTVSITSPFTGSIIRGQSIYMTATASDNVGVHNVKFYIDGKLKCTDYVDDFFSAYSCYWKIPIAQGKTYKIHAVATDAAGNKGTSQVVTLTTTF